MRLDDSFLSLNEYEMEILMPFNFEAKEMKYIFHKTDFYFYRDCVTCNIQRKPKASHCAICNNCVVGYDHHCVLLNNCIGKRNVRVYVIFIICVWIFAFLSAGIAVISLLEKPVIEKLRKDELIEYDYSLIVIISLIKMQSIKFFLGLCIYFKWCISYTGLLRYMFIELIISLTLGLSTRSFTIAITAPMFSVSLSYIVFSFGLIWTHLGLVAKHQS